MLPTSRSRGVALARRLSRTFSSTATWRNTDNPVPVNDPQLRTRVPKGSASNTPAVSAAGAGDMVLEETEAEGAQKKEMQAPNREGTWSRSQRPRGQAMVGPRFEQTIMEDQPRPLSAMELIHKQPVRWSDKRVVSCDGGGGPLGHPRVFINIDKPDIIPCEYCGLPFANNHHRKHLESQPRTSYPLEPSGDAAQVGTDQRVTNESFAQR